MRLITVAEAAQYDLKEKVPALRGKITRINDRRSGVTNGKGWSFQNLEIADLTNGAIRLRVKVWNRDDIPKTWTNKIVLVESVEGERGPKGCTIEQDTYKWQEGQPIKKQLEIQCDDGCQFELADDRGGQQSHPPQNQQPPARQQAAPQPQGGGRSGTAGNQSARPTGRQNDPGWVGENDQQPPDQRQQPADPPAPRKTAQELAAERAEGYTKAIIDTGKFIGRKVSGFACVLAAMDALQEKRQAMGKPLTADQFQGMCTSIFIAGDRSFQWDKLPTTLADLEKFWPEKKQPANTQQAAQ